MVLSVKTRVGCLSRKDYGDSLDLRPCSSHPKTCKQCLGKSDAVSFKLILKLGADMLYSKVGLLGRTRKEHQ